MELFFTPEEKDIFKQMQAIRNGLTGSKLAPAAIEKIFLQLIALNRLSESKLQPPQGEFEALIDDIEAYVSKSLKEFITFIGKS